MLKKRIVPLMLLREGRLVKGVAFSDYRDVGDPVKSAQVYSDQDADELVLINIEGDKGLSNLVNILPDLTKNVFMPLTLGGGIRSFSDAALLINSGSDKVILNSAVYVSPSIIGDIANRFGVQSVVVSIDVRKHESGYVLYSHNGLQREAVALDKHVQLCIDHGAGEILIQNIDNDGTMKGFDIELGKYVHDISSVPVILSAGSGDYSHLKDAFVTADVAAIACGSLFNFSDSSPIRAKSYLSNYGVKYKQK